MITMASGEVTGWHQLEAGEVLGRLEVEPWRGLEAAEVARRLERFGPNVVTARRGVPGWKIFVMQFHAPLVYALVAAVVVTGVLGEWVDSSVREGINS